MSEAGEAARRLLDARRSGTPLSHDPPRSGRLSDLTRGYAVQRAYVAAHAGAPIGYKVAATSERAQAALGVDGPFYGRLLDSSSQLDGKAAQWPASAFMVRLVEPEFAVRLAADLPERAVAYDRRSVSPAVASLHPAIEIIDSAYGREGWTSAGAANLIADNAAHGAFLLGPGLDDFSAVDLESQSVRLYVDGEEVGSGTGANALGHPFNVLAWLANRLIAEGGRLKAGDIVTTGVVTPFVYLDAGQAAEADFGLLGRIGVSFAT